MSEKLSTCKKTRNTCRNSWNARGRCCRPCRLLFTKLFTKFERNFRIVWPINCKMSNRYYPMYIKGNPQLRVYLPNFFMKMVPNDKEDTANKVRFKVPVQ